MDYAPLALQPEFMLEMEVQPDCSILPVLYTAPTTVYLLPSDVWQQAVWRNPGTYDDYSEWIAKTEFHRTPASQCPIGDGHETATVFWNVDSVESPENCSYLWTDHFTRIASFDDSYYIATSGMNERGDVICQLQNAHVPWKTYQCHINLHRSVQNDPYQGTASSKEIVQPGRDEIRQLFG